MVRVAIERCESYSGPQVANAVELALSAVLPEGMKIQGRRILLKPNLLAAREPSRGVTTHPSLVGAVIDYLRQRGADVAVGDSPGGAMRGVERVWQKSGMWDLCRSKGVALVNFEAGGWVSRSIEGRSYEIARAALDFDHLVSLPKLKTHVLTLLTGAIKNTFGCVPGFRKSHLHLRYPRPHSMSKALVDVYSLVKPWVTLVDAVQAMDGNGPSSGRVRPLNFLAASTDGVALDVVLSHIIGIDPLRVPTTQEALRRGLGEGSLDRITFTNQRPEDVAPLDFEVPSNWKYFLIPSFLGRLLSRLVWVRPVVAGDRCIGCGDCIAVCAAQALAFKGGKVVVDENRCTSCLCCHEACPAGAVSLKISPLARLLR